MSFLTPTPGVDPATDGPAGTGVLLTSARQTWQMEAFPEVMREAGVSSCPAACHGQYVLAASGLESPLARRELVVVGYADTTQ